MDKQQPDRPQVLITAGSHGARYQTSVELPGMFRDIKPNIICVKNWPEAHSWASTVRIDVVVICPGANQGFKQTHTEIARLSEICGEETAIIVYTPKTREREDARVGAYVRQPKTYELAQRIREFLKAKAA